MFCTMLFSRVNILSKRASISRALPNSSLTRTFVRFNLSFSTGMGVECEILLQKSKEGVFRPGEAVVGIVNYSIDKPTKFGSIFIDFVGKGRCHWSESDSDNNTTTHSNEEEYVNIHKNLFNPADDEVLVSGTFEHPFEFLLPDDLPTSIENPICTIDYKVIVTFIKDNYYFGKKKRFEAEVLVYGYVNPCSPEPLVFGFTKDLSSLTSTNNFTVKAEMEKTFLTPGENFTLTLTVDNNTDTPITIKAELIKHFTYIAATSLTQKIQTETVDTTKIYSQPLEEKSVTKVTLSVPTLPSLYSIQHAKIVIGEYKVRVTAKVPLSLPVNRAIVEVPVVIGEKKDHLGVAAFGIEDESPPSYAP